MSIRVVLVGDDAVGKTSLVGCVVSDTFQEKDPVPVLPEVAAPADLLISPGRSVTLVDTSNRPASRIAFQQEIRAADCVLVVYDASDNQALLRVHGRWMVLIKKLTNGNIPVILVGNKIDMRLQATGSITNPNMEKTLRPLLDAHKEIEAAVDAKQMKNVREVFYFAQKAVLFPLRTLYDTSLGQLRPECVVALKRIFVLSDQDRDNALSDKEFADFQIRCYGDRVQGKILVDAKEVVRNELPSGLSDKGLTLDGFLFLHHRLVKMGHHERVWSVLKRFGYGKNLEFSAQPKKISIDTRKKMYLLSVDGIRWLENLFLSYASRDGRMTRKALESLLLPAIPPELPKAWHEYARCVPTSPPDNALTMDSFLLLWRLLIAEDPWHAVSLAFQLGYDGKLPTEGDQDTAPQRLLDVLARDPWTRRRGLEYMTKVLVLGPAMGGKTTLVEYLWNTPFSETYDPESAYDRHVMGAFQAYPGRSAVKYYLSLHEVHADDMVQPLSRYAQHHNYDVVVIVYDCNDLENIQEVWRALKRGLKVMLREAQSDAPLPVLLFANKADVAHSTDPDLLQAAVRIFENIPDTWQRELSALCDEYMIPQPRPVSLKEMDQKTQFQIGPREIRESPTRRFLRNWKNAIPKWVWWGAAACFAVGGVWVIFQILKMPLLPHFRVTSGQQMVIDVGDPEFYAVYGAHDAEPNLYNLLPEEQERFADVVAKGALQNRRPIEPIHWQFPHSPGYQSPPAPAPVEPGTLPYKTYNKPSKWNA